MATVNKDSLKSCFVNNPDQIRSQFGFRLLLYEAHEQLSVKSQDKNMLVFLTKGTISISIDKSKSVYITKPCLFLLPELSNVNINILSNSSLIILCFKEFVPMCGNNSFAELSLFKPSFTPSIRSLPLQPPFVTFLKTIEDVLNLGASCPNYHRIKEKELFFLLSMYYTQSDLALLLEPLICDDFKLKSFVYKNHQSVNTVNELVEKSGVSRTLFFEQFKKAFGVSVKQWMLRKKAEQISERLSEPDVILKEVMLDFGFSSASQFNRFCRVYLGDTPSNIVNNKHDK